VENKLKMMSSLSIPCALKEKCNPTASNITSPIAVYRRVDGLPVAWQQLAACTSAFLQIPYLRALEQAAPKGYQFFYVLIHQEDRPIGLLIAQAFYFDATQQMRLEETQQSWWQRQFMQQFQAHFLVIGNATLSGEHGFYFLPEISQKNRQRYIQKAIQLLEEQYAPKSDMIVLKDFDTNTADQLAALQNNGFHRIAIQPNMQLTLPAHWQTFDDYLNDLRSKYRVRVRRARKKAKDLVQRELTLTEIQQHESRLFELYELVAQNALMNVALLPKNYFASLKEQLGNHFQLTAYFEGETIIGFQTLIQDHHHLEAHFLGLDDRYNGTHQLYLNMLFDMVETAIEERVTTLSFGRTALEIKSSVGAVAQPMYGFIKHRFVGFNIWIPKLFQAFETEKDWVARSPFREEQ
jgi:predicted N-acyltransferase